MVVDEFYSACHAPGGVFKTFRDGVWCASKSGKTVKILDPTTNDVAYEVQACSQAEVDAAFAGAAAAQKHWAKVPLWKRAEVLKRAAAELRAHAPALAEAIRTEVAKPAADALAEVVRSAEFLEYTAEEGLRVLGEGRLQTSDSWTGQARNKLALSQRVPLGVALCIPPFNYPVNLCVSKLGPALMAGNAVVLKPPTQGSASNLLLARCFEAAGLAPGLLNVVTGRGSEIGDYLVQHAGVNAISFTGGDTGLDIARKVGMVPLQMELGGKDACIVCADADLDLAAAAIAKGGFSFSGQRCTAVKLVLAVEPIADALMAKVAAKVKALKVGMPADDAVVVPLVSAASADFVQGLVEDAVAKGAELLTGPFRREGNLIWPVLLDRVTPAMQLATVEPFGPAVPCMRFPTAEAAVAFANASRYGLQGCVFTTNIDRGLALADALSAGTVQLNGAPARGPDHFPFQGFRDSGAGAQGVRASIEFFTRTKSVVVNLSAPSYAQ